MYSICLELRLYLVPLVCPLKWCFPSLLSFPDCSKLPCDERGRCGWIGNGNDRIAMPRDRPIRLMRRPAGDSHRSRSAGMRAEAIFQTCSTNECAPVFLKGRYCTQFGNHALIGRGHSAGEPSTFVRHQTETTALRCLYLWQPCGSALRGTPSRRWAPATTAPAATSGRSGGSGATGAAREGLQPTAALALWQVLGF